VSENLAQVFESLVRRMQEPLGLDRWTIKVALGPMEGEDLAGCFARPEYASADLQFDLEKFETGDELDETVVHEMSHPHTWPIHAVAEHNANCIAEMAPDSMREALRKKLLEEVRVAAETTNTQVGFTYVRLLRRLWKAEGELAAARAEVKALRKHIKTEAA
jgi:hypothetical protein